MADSTAAKRTRKASEFPLKKHPRGYWYKYVAGRYFYFEKLSDDPDGSRSVKQWADEKDHIHAYGERPELTAIGTRTVKDICNHWISHKETLLEAGDLAQRTYDEYKATCELLLGIIGKTLPAKTCGPKHFERIRKELADRYNANGQSKRITQIRSVFVTAHEDRLLDEPPNFGRSFRKPSAKSLRQIREAKGDQSYTPDQIRALLAEATVNMRAMILLGLQAGFGNADCAYLPRSAIKDGWISWARVKNAISRRVPLWPETQAALEAAISHADECGESKLCFVATSGKDYFEGDRQHCRLAKQFKSVRDRAKVDSARTFYDLRRTFETVAGETVDQVAVDAIMGHTPSESNMAARYRQRISDERLIAVVSHVREWLGPIGGGS